MKIVEIIFGRHQALFALVAVIPAAIGFVLYHTSAVSEEQYLQSLAGYIMTYLISLITWFQDRKNNLLYSPKENFFMELLWRYIRIPYWITVFTTIVYFIELNRQVGRILIYSGYLTLACALASVAAWLLLRQRAPS